MYEASFNALVKVENAGQIIQISVSLIPLFTLNLYTCIYIFIAIALDGTSILVAVLKTFNSHVISAVAWNRETPTLSNKVLCLLIFA